MCRDEQMVVCRIVVSDWSWSQNRVMGMVFFFFFQLLWVTSKAFKTSKFLHWEVTVSVWTYRMEAQPFLANLKEIPTALWALLEEWVTRLLPSYTGPLAAQWPATVVLTAQQPYLLFFPATASVMHSQCIGSHSLGSLLRDFTALDITWLSVSQSHATSYMLHAICPCILLTDESLTAISLHWVFANAVLALVLQLWMAILRIADQIKHWEPSAIFCFHQRCPYSVLPVLTVDLGHWQPCELWTLWLPVTATLCSCFPVISSHHDSYGDDCDHIYMDPDEDVGEEIYDDLCSFIKPVVGQEGD